MLAKGYRKTEVAEAIGVDRSTIYNWLDDPEFAEEVDRLSLMTDVASRSERIRIAMRVVRQAINDEGLIATEKDVLDWLKFVQSETQGAKVDFSKLAELFTGQEQSSSPIEPPHNNPLSLSAKPLGQVIDVPQPDEQPEQPATTDNNP